MLEKRIDRDIYYINPDNVKVAEFLGDSTSIAYVGGSSESVQTSIIGKRFDHFIKCTKYAFNPDLIAYGIIAQNNSEVVVVTDGGNTYRFSDIESVNTIKSSIQGLTVALGDGRTYVINHKHITRVISPYVESQMYIKDTQTGETKVVPVDLREVDNSPACISYITLRSGQQLPVFTGMESKQVDGYCKALVKRATATPVIAEPVIAE